MALSVPNTFSALTTIESAKVNANFTALLNALDKRGDTLTGNLTVDPGVTIDGVDISAVIGTGGTLLAVNGAAITALNASALASGTVPTARLGSGTANSGTFLRGDGTWATARTKPLAVYGPQSNQPPASAYATLDTRNGHLVLDFDGSSDEEAVFPGVLSPDYAGGGLTCEIFVAFTSATSGSVRFQAAIERMDASSLDIDSDSFASFQSAGGTAPGTSGQIIKIAITFTDGAQMDSLAAGEAFRLKIRRDADGTSGTDDITTDAEVLRVVLREP